MILKEWLYLVVKKLSTLLRGITSKHVDDFHCFDCLHWFKTKTKPSLNLIVYSKIKIFFEL